VGGRGQNGLAQAGSAASPAIGELPGNTVRRERDIFVAPKSGFTTEARRTRRRKKEGNQENSMTVPDSDFSVFLFLFSLFLFSLFLFSLFFFVFFCFFLFLFLLFLFPLFFLFFLFRVLRVSVVNSLF
jgi:hypothetical protein